MTNFDNVHSRLNTNSVKWDSIATTYKEEGFIAVYG
jgi:cystathionine beta-lyase